MHWDKYHFLTALIKTIVKVILDLRKLDGEASIFFSGTNFMNYYTMYPKAYFVVVFQLLSHIWLFETPWTAACQASLSFTISWSLLKLMSSESVMPTNHLILCHPLLLMSSIFPSISIFSNESVLHIRWPKHWSFSFSISPSNEYTRTDFLWDWLVWSPCSPRDSQEPSPTPQFKNINSLGLSLLYVLTLTSIHDYWKNHSFD